jgi:transcription antitermination protein NusB
MSRRTEQRRAAVFALYQHEVTGKPIDEVFERDASAFTKGLAHAVLDHQDEFDEIISAHLQPDWTLERLPPLERAILRVGLLELLHGDLTIAETPIPPEGAIDEAVETAKLFCGAQAPAFVNGVLAAVLREGPGTRRAASR